MNTEAPKVDGGMKLYYNGDWQPLEKTVLSFARKMSRELGSDLNLNTDSREVIFAHVFNCLWEPLIREIVRDQKRKRKLTFTRLTRKAQP